MHKTLLPILLLALLLPAWAQPNLIPTPKTLTTGGTDFQLTGQTRILYQTRADQPRALESSLAPQASVLAEEVEILTGIRPPIGQLDSPGTTAPTAADIVLAFQPLADAFAVSEAEEDQSYTLTASGTDGVRIESQYTKGVSYGSATLVQALTETTAGAFTVPGLTIADEPDAAFRTIMIDVARKPHSIQVLEGVIRTARLYKYRYVHLHLTDDQHFTFPFPPITDNIDGNNVYPRQELDDLVAFANARGVTLIPELDLPGHSSRLRASGYLNPSANDRDVADIANRDKINAIIDDMLDVFVNTPYFHIGGDESAAGSELVPFLQRVNQHIRAKPQYERPRLLVWEGFHGAPTAELPPTGDDRVVVVSWESSYNSPWDLLNAGYQIVNGSWKPMYVVGGGGLMHPGNGARKFELDDMYTWTKDIFMHWEPGRPVYEDVGPNDPDRTDAAWHAQYIDREDQVIGGQMLFWEQSEEVVLDDLRERAPVSAQRMWNPVPTESLDDFLARLGSLEERMLAIIQPIEILPGRDFAAQSTIPINYFYQQYEGAAATITMRNRTRIPGTIRFTEEGFGGTFTYINFGAPDPVSATAAAYTAPFTKADGFSLRARLFRPDGTPVGSETWTKFNNWVPRLRVTEYDLGKENGATTVPDLLALPESDVIKRYTMPFIRGRLPDTRVAGQRQMSILTAPGTGEFTLIMRSQSGHASLWIDLNQDGTWDANEKLIANTANDERNDTATASLTQGETYALRIDHKCRLPRSVLLAEIEGPNTTSPGNPAKSDLSNHLSLPGPEDPGPTPGPGPGPAPDPADGLVTYEPFDYPDGSAPDGPVPLNGGTGWSAAWTAQNINGSAAVGDTGLTYTTLPVTGGSIELDPTADTPSTVLRRTLDRGYGTDGTTTWISYLLHVRDVANGHAFLAAPGLEFGKMWGTALAVNNNASDVNAADGNTYFLVARIDHTATGDTLHMWVNPALAAEPTNAAANLTLNGLNVTFPHLDINVQGHGRGHYDFDEIRLGKTWATVTGVVPDPPPDAPEAPDASKDKDGFIELNWSPDPSRPINYTIWRSTSSDPNTAQQIGTTAQTTFTDTNLPPDTTYHYWVSASNDAGESPLAGPAPGSTAPVDTIQLEIKPAEGNALFEWNCQATRLYNLMRTPNGLTPQWQVIPGMSAIPADPSGQLSRRLQVDSTHSWFRVEAYPAP